MAIEDKIQQLSIEERFFSLLHFVFSSHDPDAAQIVYEMVTNGFVLSSRFLIVFVYRQAFVSMFLRLSLSVQSPSLRETQCDIESCLVLREYLFMPAYKGVNNDSFELAVKWKLRMLKKDIWPLHLYICQTILQVTDKICTLNTLYILESNQWPWHCWCHA